MKKTTQKTLSPIAAAIHSEDYLGASTLVSQSIESRTRDHAIAILTDAFHTLPSDVFKTVVLDIAQSLAQFTQIAQEEPKQPVHAPKRRFPNLGAMLETGSACV